jgi:hypothetical protein
MATGAAPLKNWDKLFVIAHLLLFPSNANGERNRYHQQKRAGPPGRLGNSRTHMEIF